MTQQPNLFDQPDELAALEAKEEAIDRVLYRADWNWTNAARWAIERCAETLEDFTADDVWEWLATNCPHTLTHEPSALGPVFLICSREGVIRKTGMVRPTRHRHRHRELTVWTAKGNVA